MKAYDATAIAVARAHVEAWCGQDWETARDLLQTYVRFRHSGWKENSEFHAHCSMKWATFMLSLKDLLDSGKGRPTPDDLAINHS